VGSGLGASRRGKTKAKLRLYIGGTVKARLDRSLPFYPVRGARRDERAASSFASTLPPKLRLYSYCPHLLEPVRHLSDVLAFGAGERHIFANAAIRRSKPKARLRLYVGGNVEAKLDETALPPSRCPHGENR